MNNEIIKTLYSKKHWGFLEKSRRLLLLFRIFLIRWLVSFNIWFFSWTLWTLILLVIIVCFYFLAWLIDCDPELWLRFSRFLFLNHFLRFWLSAFDFFIGFQIRIRILNFLHKLLWLGLGFWYAWYIYFIIWTLLRKVLFLITELKLHSTKLDFTNFSWSSVHWRFPIRRGFAQRSLIRAIITLFLFW